MPPLCGANPYPCRLRLDSRFRSVPDLRGTLQGNREPGVARQPVSRVVRTGGNLIAPLGKERNNVGGNVFGVLQYVGVAPAGLPVLSQDVPGPDYPRSPGHLFSVPRIRA